MNTCRVCSNPVKTGRKYYCSRGCYFTDRQRENHPGWKGGGRRKSAEGYVRTLIYQEHPFYGEMGRYHSKISRDVLEHRLVMAEHLGRPLRDDETVHHKNGVKDDNRLENLELRNGRHGRGAAMCCGDCGSRNLVTCG
jgi:hypothetical protein